MSVRLLTPPGAGGIAVLELAGPLARERLARVWCGARAARPGTLKLARLEFDGEPLDEALVWIESAARIELHLHGSPPLVRALLSRLAVDPAPIPSGADEPAAIEERAWRSLPHAASEAGARLLLDQARGALRAELLRILALGSRELVRDSLGQLLESARLAQRCVRATKVALVGPVNAGKSTLFNALVGEQRAIVGPAPGVTRDLLVARTRLGEWPVELVDTAGERELAGRAGPSVEIEASGQRLARDAQRDAEWIVRLFPSDRPSDGLSDGFSNDSSDGSSDGSRAGATLGGGRTRGETPQSWVASRSDTTGRALPGCDAALCAGPDPHGAAATIAELFHATFALPQRAWSAGRAAPFDARSVDGVTAAFEAAREGRDGWRAPLAALLAD